MPRRKQKTTTKKGFVGRLHMFIGWLGLGWPKSKLASRLLIGLLASIVIVIGGMYGIAQWYIAKHKSEPLVIGSTFIPSYARFFDLNAKETLEAIIKDLDIKRVRFVSYWNEGEPKPGKYNFSELDWQFKMAEENNVDVSLAIGLRQPRWPECHMPEWAKGLPKEDWSERLKTYMKKVIERYKDSPSLVSYQLENEYFLQVFGECPDHSRERLVDEYNFVKQLDPTKPLIVTRSDNAVPSWPVGEPRADIIGASIYKRVWDKTITNRYFEYPFPAWFYAFLAGGAELTTGRNTFIHELQTEAWLPDKEGFSFGFEKNYYHMNDRNSITEQNKSLNAERLAGRFDYGVATGMKTIDVWGPEWWYWRKVKVNDPSLWNTAKEKIRQYNGQSN